MVEKLKQLYIDGEIITFDIVNHPRIPSVVLVNGSVFGRISITDMNKFNIWKQNK
jgi:hypothetical protein